MKVIAGAGVVPRELDGGAMGRGGQAQAMEELELGRFVEAAAGEGKAVEDGTVAVEDAVVELGVVGQELHGGASLIGQSRSKVR